MELEKFKDVHPNWDRIEHLSPDEAPATINLLLAGVFLDGKISDEELQALAETWERLPFVGPHFGGSTFVENLTNTRQELMAILKNPSLFEGFLTDAGERISTRGQQVAVLRLLAIVLSEDDLHERQQEYFYAVASEFGIDLDLAEDLLRAAWGSYRDDKVTAEGEERMKPLVKGKNFADQTRFKVSQNPFAQPLQ